MPLSKRSFEDIFAGMTDAVLVLDRELRHVYANPSAAQLVGVPLDQLVGRTWDQLFDPARSGDARRLVHEVITTTRALRSEAAFTIDGERRDLEYLLTPILDDRREVALIVAVGRDVTERRMVERAARAASAAAEQAAARTARLQATTMALSAARTAREAADVALREGLATFGAHGSVLYLMAPDGAHAELYAANGYDAEMLERYRLLPREADTPVVLALHTGLPAFYESRDEILARHPSAHLQPATVGAMTLPLTVESRTIGAIGLTFTRPVRFTDDDRAFAAAVAQQCAQAVERALLADRERDAGLRAEFLAAASEILSSSLDYETVLANFAALAVPRIADWCGIEMVAGDSTEQVAVAHVDPAKVSLARELRERYPPDRAAPQGVYEVIRTGKAEIYPEVPQALLRAAARDEAHLETILSIGMRSAMIVPLEARGRTLGAITLVWAESAKNYTERDLAFAREIARRAALAVDNARLYGELQEAVRARDDFLGVAGHELRTPLSALMMQLQSLHRLTAKDSAFQKYAERLAKAASAGSRLAKLIDELLDVSRIVAGRLHIERETVDLSALVAEVTSRFADSATRAGLVIDQQIEPAVVGQWDPSRLEQVITNLLANAIKYGDGKPVSVQLISEGEDAVLRIEDHGIGIDASQQSRIFERFERAVGTREYGGIGLGLWITREVVSASGGTVEVQSAPGHGATFTVRLPKHAGP